MRENILWRYAIWLPQNAPIAEGRFQIGQEKLKNPPEEHKSAHESLSECYDAYLTFTGLAVNLTGSLNTFSEDFENADTEFLHCYHVMEFYVQD